MARIPSAADLPSVSPQQTRIPASSRPDPAPSDLSTVAKTGFEAADTLMRLQARDDANFVAQAKADLHRRATMAWIETERNAPEDGIGFARSLDAAIAGFETEIGSSARGVSQAGIGAFSKAATALRSRVFSRAAIHEERLRVASHIKGFDRQIAGLEASVFSDPDSFADAFVRAESMVDALATSAGADEAAARRDLILPRLGEFRVKGLVDQGRYDEAEFAVRGDDETGSPIPAERRPVLLNEIRVRREQAGAQERAEIRTLARDHLASIQSTGQGIVGLSERARAVLDPKAYESFRRDEVLASEAFRFTDGARFATPQAMQQSLDRFKPVPGSEGFADRQRVHDHLSRTAAALLKARTDDPAGYGLQEPNVRQAWETAQKDPASIPVYAAKALALQSAMGIPERSRRVLPVGAASAIVTDLSAPEGAERAADTIQKLQENYGPYWPRVYAELVENRMPPRMAVLASLDTAADAAVRKDAAQFIKAGDKVLIAALNPTDKTEIDRTLPDASARWAKVELARGATERNVQSMRDFIRTLAYGYAGRGQSPSDAVKNATEAVLGRYDILDSGRFALAVPKGRSAAVEATGERILNEISPEDLPDPGGAAELTDAQRRAAYLDSLRRTGRWVLNERGDGAFLVDAVGNPVMIREDDRTMRLEFGFDGASTEGTTGRALRDWLLRFDAGTP